MSKKNTRRNRVVDAAIMMQPWLIEANYAMRLKNRYEQEINLMANGADYKSLGFSERRAASLSHRIEAGDYIENLFHSTYKGAGVIKFTGPLMAEDGPSHYGVDHLNNLIREYDSNTNLAGTIMELDTGGGDSVAAIKSMNAIAETTKPFIVLVTGTSASGGVLMTTTADEIIGANEGIEVGSIGAYWAFDKGMAESYKEDVDWIYSDYSQDKNKAFREYINGNPELIQEQINDLDKFFMKTVDKHLDLNPALKKETLRGGMFRGKDAKKRGLIHGIGDINYAIKRLAILSKNYKS